MRVERSAEVAASPERVYSYLADIERHPEWASTPMTIEPLGGSGAGARFRHRARMMGPQEDIVVVTEAEAPRRFAFESTGKAGVIRHWFEIGPGAEGRSARVTRGMEVLRPALMTRLMAPVIAAQSAKFFEADLRRIGERLAEAPV